MSCGQHSVSASTHDRGVEDIARELESYVERHPAAADTVAGIARWWLPPVQPPLADVEAALDLLIHRGVLSRRALPDGHTLYARVRPA
jgi:hypothetical protein